MGSSNDPPASLRRLGAWLGARDARALDAVSWLLFVIAALPVLLVPVLPYQDLPSHLASVHALWNPAKYTEFVGNGFFKTNAALFAWLYVAGRVLGLHLASKVFTLVVLALGAWILPRLFFELTGKRSTALTACLFVWPMIGNWWVLMGMLDYALALPLSLWIVLLASRNVRAPKSTRSLGLALLGLVCWYAHAAALLIVGLLLVIEGIAQPDRKRYVRSVIAPLLPAAALVVYSLVLHMTEPEGAMTGDAHFTQLLPNWQLAYHLWAEWCCGFGWRSLSSFAVVIGGVWGLWRINTTIPFFSTRAMAVLALAYMLAPYSLTNWFHAGSRFIPYLWIGLLLRVPERLPRVLTRVMVLAAALFTVGHTLEYQLLDRDRRALTAGLEAVPRDSRMLPLIFTGKLHSEHTQSLLHAWGYYVIERDVSAPLLFAHSRAFPLMYREPPPPRFNHLVLESFPGRMRKLRSFCERNRANSQIIHDDCVGEYRNLWDEFWRDAEPRFDTLLVWDIPDETRALLPSSYVESFREGRLSIYRRDAR